MKEYPHIEHKISWIPIYAFDKLDGSSVRAEWSRKQGFYKFGKRNGLLDDQTPYLIQAKDLILEKSDQFDKIFKDMRIESAVAFFEFWGPNSFSGWHVDEPHRVTLIDVNIYKKGMMSPKDFVKTFSDCDPAKLLYTGVMNQNIIDQVKNSTLEGMTFEGVVCKGEKVFKIKSNAWLDHLHKKCIDESPDEEKANKLFEFLR